jgi:single-strand DNA-binding protein
MAYHKLTLIGRLVGDPRFRSFDNGGGVAKFGLPVNFMRPKKNPATGQWEGDSFIIDVDAFNRETRKLGDLVMQFLKKGSQVYVEGRLKPNEYTDKNGVKVFKPVLVADVIEFLDGRSDGAAAGEEGMRSTRGLSAAAPRKPEAGSSANGGGNYSDYGGEPEPMEPPAGGGGEEEIPF